MGTDQPRIHPTGSKAEAVAAPARSKRSKRRCRTSTTRSWWCCKQAPTGLQLAVMLFSWCFLLLLVWMPSLVKGHDVLKEDVPNSKSKPWLLPDVENDSSAARRESTSLLTIPEDLGRTKELKEPPPGGTELSSDSRLIEGRTVLQGQLRRIKVCEDDGDSTEKHVCSDQGWTSSTASMVDSQENPVSCSSSTVPNLVQQVSFEASPPSESVKHWLTSEDPSPAAPNVRITPPFLDWGPRFLFSPSLESLTVVNTCNSSGLYVFQPFSTNPQFYTVGFQEITLPPGGMVSIPVIFLPRTLGTEEGLLVVQTSAGGFLVQVHGEGLKSPYQLQPLSGLSALSGTPVQLSVVLYNPYDEHIHIEEVNVWISGTHKRSFRLSKSGADRGKGEFCNGNALQVESSDNSAGNLNWMAIPADDNSHKDPVVSVRISGKWKIGPHCSNPIMELQVLADEKKPVTGALCIKVIRHSQESCDTMILPLDVQSKVSISDSGEIYAVPPKLDFGVLTEREEERKQIIILGNAGPDYVQVGKIFPSSEDSNIIDIKYSENLVLHPRTEQQVATITYIGIEQRTSLIYSTCVSTKLCGRRKLIVQTNCTVNPNVEIPYQALVLHGSHNCSSFDSPVREFEGFVSVEGMCKPRRYVQLRNGFNVPLNLLRELEKAWSLELDGGLQPPETVLDPTCSSQSIFDGSELLFPMVQIGRQGMQWVNVSNPSDKPLAVKLMVSSKAGATNCKHKKGATDVGYTADQSKCASGSCFDVLEFRGQGSVGIENDIFSVAKDGIVDAIVPPRGRTALGPIVFNPVERCVWTSLLTIRNNLTSMEWMPLQGSGGSIGLTFLDGDDPVQVLKLDFNFTTQPTPIWRTFKQHIFELFDDRSSKSACHHHVTRDFLAKNTGDMPLQVETMTLAGGGCVSHGFQIDSCGGFYLNPGQATQLHVSYRPDFTAAVFKRDLQLATSFGILSVPLTVSLPGHIHLICQKPSIFSKFLLHICLVALFSVLVVFIKMLKQEQILASEPQHWPSKSPVHIHSVNLRTGGKGTSHVNQRMKGFESPTSLKAQGKHTASEMGGPVSRNEKIARNSNFLSVLSSLISSVRSAGGSQDFETFHDINLKISGVGTSPRGLPKLNTGHIKQGSDFLLNSIKTSEKECDLSQSRNHLFKNELQSPTMDMDKGTTKSAVGSVVASESNIVRESSLQQHLHMSSLLMVVPGSPKKELQSRQVISSSAESLSHKFQQESPKGRITEKEKKDKGKRRKRRSSIINLRQERESGGRSGSSSPPSSPASPATPVNSYRPVSPFFQSDSLSGSLMPGQTSPVQVKSIAVSDSFHKGASDQPDSNRKHACANSTSDGHPVGDLDIGRTGCPTLQKISGSSNPNIVWSARDGHADRSKQEGACRPSKDWAAVARRGTTTFTGADPQDSDQSFRASSANRNTNIRPVLTTSATFPRGGRSSGWNLPVLEEEKPTWSACMPSSSLATASVIPPNARAPGTRISKQCLERPIADLAITNSISQAGGCGEGSGRLYGNSGFSLAEANGVADRGTRDFVYDIWGDHFAEISCSAQSSGPMRTREVGDNVATNKSSLLENSQSFFAKSEFMMQLGAASVVSNPVPYSATPVGSSFSIFSGTESMFASHSSED